MPEFYVTLDDDYSELRVKREIIRREAPIVSREIRKLVKRTPLCKMQLERMANDFMNELNLASYSLNTCIPDISFMDPYKHLSFTCKTLTQLAKNIQYTVYKDFDDLKEELAESVEKLESAVGWFEDEYRVPDFFVATQLNQKNNILIYSINKIKFESLYFDRTDEELGKGIAQGLQDVTQMLKSLSKSGRTTVDELQRILHQLAFITERIVCKLENWVDLNKNGDQDDIKLVLKVSKALAKLFSKEICCANETRYIPKLKKNLVRFYEATIAEILKLIGIQYVEDQGGQAFIQSILFDAITVTRTPADNLPNILRYM